MNWSDPEHPIWRVIETTFAPLVRTIAILLTLVLVLWMNAEHFDETEIKTILTMFFAVLGVEGFVAIRGVVTRKE